MMKLRSWSFAYSCLFIVIALLVSYLVMMVVDPELFAFHRRGFMLAHDTELPIENIFSLISNFFNGGIQLWDPYDQMNYAYTQLSSGIYTLSNILTAALYIIVYPFLDYPGETLYSFHIIVWHGINMAIRTIGGFLLLRRFTANPWIILISIVYLNSLLTNEVYMGLLTNNLYSYLPLLLFFIIRFFDEYRLNDFLAALVVMTLAVADSPLFGLGYFYMVVHFFIVCCLIYALFFKEKNSSIKVKSTKSQIILKLCVTAGLCFLILLPTLYWSESLKQDFYIEGSGFDNTEGRMSKLMSPSMYFKVEKSNGSQKIGRANPDEFLEGSIDFGKNNMYQSWIFLGASTLFLSIVAMIFSKNKLKHVFFWTIALVILSNTPIDGPFYFAIAHWINGYTNPFSSLLRSFHMSALLMPTLFLPLIALGIESIVDFKRCYTNRVLFGCIFFLGIILYLALTPHSTLIKNYPMAIALAFLLIFYLLRSNYRPKVIYVILGLVVIADLAALSVYLKREKHMRYLVEPKTFTDLSTNSPLILEYQNPKILPLREYFQAMRRKFKPRIYSLQGHYGLFYQFTPMDRFFEKADIYAPRPKAYKGMDLDKEMQDYLKSHNHLFSFTSNESPQPKPLTYEFKLSEAAACDVSNGKEYSIRLPDDFPSYLSTTVFTDDINSWSLSIDGQMLKVAQGKLVIPWTFDVQNVKTGYLVILLPKDFQVNTTSAKLQVKPLQYLTTVWKNEHDSLGWTYEAQKDGEIVIRYPYDPKWRLTIDDKPFEFHKAEGYFIGFPLAKGEHKILLEYWPQTWLRLWIGISIFALIISFAVVVWYGISNHRKEIS